MTVLDRLQDPQSMNFDGDDDDDIVSVFIVVPAQSPATTAYTLIYASHGAMQTNAI